MIRIYYQKDSVNDVEKEVVYGGIKVDEIRELFATIKDNRHQGYVKHRLVDILIIVMGGAICGITELAEMMVYFKRKQTFFTKYIME